jgi:RNA polymerase sigma factor (sigma-70 family)
VSDPSDPDLVRRCLAGEEDAWRLLTERYADLVHGVARRAGLDAEGAGDVVQEVFVALVRSLGRLQRAERLAGWIAQAARRESWRQVRRRRAARGREQAAARPEAIRQPLPDAALAALEEEHLVRMAYGAIGERCRRLLDRLFVSGVELSYAEIAAELGVAVGSIGPTRQRCLAHLMRELERLGLRPDAPARRRPEKEA